jgi:hypothetical protein
MCVFHQILLGDKFKEDKNDGSCSTLRKDWKSEQIVIGKSEGKLSLEGFKRKYKCGVI